MVERSRQEKLFGSYKGGDESALSDLLDSERDHLFDYLMRMTGRFNRSADSVNEVFSFVVNGAIDCSRSFSQFRASMYEKVREANSDIWNADTSRLENTAIARIFAKETSPDINYDLLIQRQEVDSCISLMNPQRREGLILHVRYGFSVAETVKIMKSNLAKVSADIEAALAEIAHKVVDPPAPAVRSLESHPLPTEETQYMTDLQEIIGGIKKDVPGELARFVRQFLALCLLVGAGYLFFEQPKWLFEYWDMIVNYLREIFM